MWLWDNHVTDKLQTPRYPQPFVLRLFSSSPATWLNVFSLHADRPTDRPTERSDRLVMGAYYRSYQHMAPSLTCRHDSHRARKPRQWTLYAIYDERELSPTIRNEKWKCFRCPKTRTKMKILSFRRRQWNTQILHVHIHFVGRPIA